jgi:hypothetical protein
MSLQDLANLVKNAYLDRAVKISENSIKDIILKKEIDARVLYLAAEEDGIPEQNKDIKQVNITKDIIIRNMFFDAEIEEKCYPTDDEIEEYYNSNIANYTKPTYRNIVQFVAKDKKNADKNLKEIQKIIKAKDLKKMLEHIRNHSLYGYTDGIIKNVFKDGKIPSIGDDLNYNKKVWVNKIGTLSNVFKNVNNEYVFFYVESEIEPQIAPISSVENEIARNLFYQKIEELTLNMLNKLYTDYGVVLHYDRLVSQLSAEDLFNATLTAQMKNSNTETIFFLNQIISEYAETEYAYEALFMKAFLTAENNSSTAIEALETLIKKYPNGNLNSTAEIILKSLKSNNFNEIDIRTLKSVIDSMK